MDLHLKVIGILLIILAVSHTFFPSYFKWKHELNGLSMINRQMFYVHSFFIAFSVLLMGVLCLTSTRELLATHLGKKVLLGLGIFWVARLCIQLFGYSSKLWKGKSFETSVHIFLIVLWAYLSGVFIYSFLGI